MDGVVDCYESRLRDLESTEQEGNRTCTFGDAGHCVLRCDVRCLPGQSGVRVGRSDIDDRASTNIACAISAFNGARFLCCHCFGHGTNADQDSLDVDTHHSLKIFNRAVRYGYISLLGDLAVNTIQQKQHSASMMGFAYASTVDTVIHSPKVFNRGVNHALDAGCIRYIDFKGKNAIFGIR